MGNLTKKFFLYTRTSLGKIISGVFIIGLIYMLLPGPSSIDDFPPLPHSIKSDLEGDTIQNPNIAAYYSDFRRDGITKFYKQIFGKKLLFGLYLPPIPLNHRPEYAYQYVRDQQESTFLEEYIFPLRESIFVNGYEPEIENIMNNNIRSFEGDHILVKGQYYNSKATLRFYPSSVFLRVLVYLGMWTLAVFMLRVYRSLIS